MPAANGGRASGSPLSHSNHYKPARRDASAFSVQCAIFAIHRTLNAEQYSALSHDAAQAVPPHDTTVCRPRHPRGHIVRLDHTGPRAAQLTVHAIAAGGRVAALRSQRPRDRASLHPGFGRSRDGGPPAMCPGLRPVRTSGSTIATPPPSTRGCRSRRATSNSLGPA